MASFPSLVYKTKDVFLEWYPGTPTMLWTAHILARTQNPPLP